MLIGVLKSTNDYVTGKAEEGKEGIGNIPEWLLGPMLITANSVPFLYLLFTIVKRVWNRKKKTNLDNKKKRTGTEKNHRYSSATQIMPLPELELLSEKETQERAQNEKNDTAKFQAWD